VCKAKRAHHSLAKRSRDIPHVSTPISNKQPTFDETVKAAILPIHDARHMSVFHGIKMDVFDMAREISVIANRVLPIATLPYALLAP
jgi:hypothetical protein